MRLNRGVCYVITCREYRPISTPLSRTSEPIDVARGFFSIYPFATLYVADLDAIEGRGDNGAALARLKATFTDLTLWVDNGIARLGEAERWLDGGLGHLVLGSESQADTALVRRFADDPRVEPDHAQDLPGRDLQ